MTQKVKLKPKKQTIHVRLTHGEYMRTRKAAEIRGVTVSEFARSLLGGYQSPEPGKAKP